MGGDILHGHRAKWDQWGGPPFNTPDFKKERTYLAASAYALVATGVPFVDSDKHRLISSLHGGIGQASRPVLGLSPAGAANWLRMGSRVAADDSRSGLQ